MATAISSHRKARGQIDRKCSIVNGIFAEGGELSSRAWATDLQRLGVAVGGNTSIQETRRFRNPVALQTGG